MWTEQHRKIYRRVERRYPSDMTDSEWARLEPLIPPAKPGGRPRETNMREAINAFFAPVARGVIFLARDFRPVRPSTISFATSRKLVCGTRSGNNCIWICVKTWGVKRAPRRHASSLRRPRLDPDRNQTTLRDSCLLSQALRH